MIRTDLKPGATPDMKRLQVHGVEHTCPTCGPYGKDGKGDGKHRGPHPWPNCLRCGGYGTVVRMGDEHVRIEAQEIKRPTALTDRIEEEEFDHF